MGRFCKLLQEYSAYSSRLHLLKVVVGNRFSHPTASVPTTHNCPAAVLGHCPSHEIALFLFGPRSPPHLQAGNAAHSFVTPYKKTIPGRPKSSTVLIFITNTSFKVRGSHPRGIIQLNFVRKALRKQPRAPIDEKMYPLSYTALHCHS
jgi:hypothetical protein